MITGSLEGWLDMAWWGLPVVFGAAVGAASFHLFAGASRQFVNRNPVIRDMGRRLMDLRRQCIRISLLLGVLSFVTMAWAVYAFRFARTGSADSAAIALFLNGVGPLAAVLFFAYQVIAGSMFATVSVSATATRVAGRPDLALLQVALERGDKWLVEVPRVTYRLGKRGRQEVEFPRRTRSAAGQKVSWMRLGPGEKTASMQLVTLASSTDQTIDVCAESYALWWPAPSMAFCRVVIPPLPPEAIPTNQS